jgi:hypothetical protein
MWYGNYSGELKSRKSDILRFEVDHLPMLWFADFDNVTVIVDYNLVIIYELRYGHGFSVLGIRDWSVEILEQSHVFVEIDP